MAKTKKPMETKSIFEKEYAKVETNATTKTSDDSKTYLYWKHNSIGNKKTIYDTLSSIPQKCEERRKMYAFVELCIINKKRIEQLKL